MATIKQGEKDYLEEHSKQKVYFYEKYINRYLKVLLHSKYTKAINIYDVFCGVGIYAGDGSKGSPVVAMDSIKAQHNNFPEKTDVPIRLLINDGDSNKVKIAKNYIDKFCKGVCDFAAHNLPANEIFPLVKERIKHAPKENHFVFIDPHGYKDIFKKDLIDIMEAGKSELLIFLPIHTMRRFLKPSREDTENLSYEPLRRFMEEFDLNYDVASSREYILRIQEAFRFNQKYFTTSFRLETSSGNSYALFFITKHIKGLEKAVETKWALDQLCGKGHEKVKPVSLFEEEEKEEKQENCLHDLETALSVYLQEERTNQDLYQFSLTNGFLIKHTNGILKELQEEDKLVFDRKVRKSSFYLNSDHYKENSPMYKVIINE